MLETAHLQVRHVLAEDAGRQPLRLLGDSEQDAVPVEVVAFG
jgi:hypothetical protein